jgi:hypothetical protein
MSKGLRKKRNGIIKPTITYLLTFGMPKLPTNIKVGLYQMKIEMFVLNLLGCYLVKPSLLQDICYSVCLLAWFFYLAKASFLQDLLLSMYVCFLSSKS